MLTHVTDAQIDAFRRRRLAAADLVWFTDHLAECRECRRRTTVQMDTAAASIALDAALTDIDAHLTDEDLQAFVDGSLPSELRAAASAHLDECEQCAEDVRDLQAFAGQDAAQGAGDRPTRRPMYAALALAASLLLAAGGWLVLRGRPIADAGPGSAATPGASAPADPLARLSVDDRERVQRVMATQTLRISGAATELIGRPGTLLGGDVKMPFQLQSPVGTMLRVDQPVLRWTSVPGATQYVVTVQDASGSTFSSPAITLTEWTLDRPLPSGARYAWQVTALVDGRELIAPAPPAPPAQFAIITAADAARLEDLPDDPLIRGILYADAGLLDEAEQQFTRAADRAQDATVARSLLSQLLERRAAR